MKSSSDRKLRSVIVAGQGSPWEPQLRGALHVIADEIVEVKDTTAAQDSIRRFLPELAFVLEDVVPGKTVEFIQEARLLSPKTSVVVLSEGLQSR